MSLHADVNMHAEAEIAPRAVLEALFDGAVMGSVEDARVCPAEKGMCSRSAEGQADFFRGLLQPRAPVPEIGPGFGQRSVFACADFDLGCDQLAADKRAELPSRRTVQVLKAIDQIEAIGIDDLKILTQCRQSGLLICQIGLLTARDCNASRSNDYSNRSCRCTRSS